MVTIKTKEEIVLLREGGKRLAFILHEVAKAAQPGVSTKTLDALANKLATENGDIPSVLHYRPKGARRAFPASICISLNDEIVHGIPNENPKILQDGDIVSLDMCLTHKNLITDASITVPVGTIPQHTKKLLQVTQEALHAGINAAQGGRHIGDIGYAIERVAKANGFFIVEDLCGHGVGYKVHEDPFVPNTGERGTGERLRPGMVLAIEPMLSDGTSKISLDEDGYTFRTADGSLSAHFEHTIVITNKDPEVITKLPHTSENA